MKYVLEIDLELLPTLEAGTEYLLAAHIGMMARSLAGTDFEGRPMDARDEHGNLYIDEVALPANPKRIFGRAMFVDAPFDHTPRLTEETTRASGLEVVVSARQE
jgi:hypothetical protein